MNKIEVKILDHNLNGMPKFLAKLTQRGHLINSMKNVEDLYENNVYTTPSEYLLNLEHSTIRRMNYITVAITGLSTKCVSQLRTHATRLTFLSTSTQYSSYENREDNFVMPAGLTEYDKEAFRKACDNIQAEYAKLLKLGVDKDAAGYILPQALRKTLIISGNLDAWQYVIRLRLCNRNTLETQHVMRLIYTEIEKGLR